MKKGITFFLKTVLPLSIGVYLIWLFYTSMTEDSKLQFYEALKKANYFWILLSLVLGWIAVVARAQRWKYVLEPLGYTTPLKNRYHAITIGYLINLTIPRAGEATRAVSLYRSDNVPFAKSFGTIVAERAVDLVMLASIFFITTLIGGKDFELIWNELITRFGQKSGETGGFPWKYVFFGGIALGIAIVAFLYFKFPSFKEKLQNFIKGVLNGVFAIFKSKNPGAYVLTTFVIWGCYLIMFGICFQALAETSDFHIKGILIGFIAGSIGITLTNGGIGSYPLLVGLVIAFYLKEDYPNSANGIGNALGLLIWLSQTLLMIVLGLVSLVLLPKNYSAEKNVETSNDPE
jgi:hypothetical protein